MRLSNVQLDVEVGEFVVIAASERAGDDDKPHVRIVCGPGDHIVQYEPLVHGGIDR